MLVLRTSPQRLQDDSSQLTVPSTIWWQRVDETAQFGPSRPVDPPDWMEHAWELLAKERYVDDACATEGLLLAREHPSFALIAFISTIETLGAKLFPPARCPQCKQITGSGERFRRALALVEDEATAVSLSKAYGPRSRTAHSSKLHGHELMRGALAIPGLFSLGQNFDFQWRTVFAMSGAARKLLAMALTRGLPPVGDSVPDKVE